MQCKPMLSTTEEGGEGLRKETIKMNSILYESTYLTSRTLSDPFHLPKRTVRSPMAAVQYRIVQSVQLSGKKIRR